MGLIHKLIVPAIAAQVLSVGIAQAKAEKPNVLLILVDDLGYGDLGCHGVTDFKTPNIDRIAASGIRFTDGYVTAPQCGPSRAGLITGMYQTRFGVTDNHQDFGVPPRDVVELLPEQMKAQGYATGMVGKWHIGFHDLPEDRTKSYTRKGNAPEERGFDYVFRIFSGSAQFFPYKTPDFRAEIGWPKHLQEKRETEEKPTHLADLPVDTYLTDIFTTRSVDFIKRHKEEPWFLYLAYTAPHAPMQAKLDKIEKYKKIKNRTRRTFAAMMDSLDEGIGNVLKSLEETGQLNNTIIWFLSDNGGVAEDRKEWNGSRNGKFSGSKGDVFEGGVRVPFMVSWPNVLPAGKVVQEPVISLDILPTSLAAAGKSSVAEIHDGKNLLPWLKGKEDCPNDILYWSWRGSYNAVRMGTLKETRNGRETRTSDGAVIKRHQFSDLKNNPKELSSKALQSPEKKQMLAQKLDAWLQKVKRDAKKLTPKHD